MEINALFDLWDVFSRVEYTSEDAIVHPFYTFPEGTSRVFIIGWFMHQNPFFSVKEEAIEGRRSFSVMHNPFKKD